MRVTRRQLGKIATGLMSIRAVGKSFAGEQLKAEGKRPAPKPWDALLKSIHVTKGGTFLKITLQPDLLPKNASLSAKIEGEKFKLHEIAKEDPVTTHRTNSTSFEVLSRMKHSQYGHRVGLRIFPENGRVSIYFISDDVGRKKVSLLYYFNYRKATPKNPSTPTEIFKTEIIPQAKTIRHKGVVIRYTEALDKESLEEMANEASLLRSFAAKRYDVGHIYLTQEIPEHELDYYARRLDIGGVLKTVRETPYVLIGKTSDVKKGRHVRLACHEISHAVWNSHTEDLGTSEKETMRSAWLEAAGMKVEELEKHPVFSLFDESSHFDVESQYGHIEEGPGELFATGITSMRHSKRFLERLEALRENRAHFKKAIEIAHSITSLFGKRAGKVFDDKLLQYILNEKTRLEE